MDPALPALPPLLRRALWIAAALHGLGWGVLALARSMGLGIIDGEPRNLVNIFHVLFETNEPFGLLVSALILALATAALLLRRRPGSSRIPASEEALEALAETPAPRASPEEASPEEKNPAPPSRARRMGTLAIGILALGAAVVTWIGTETVYHGYPLSMDEYGAEMQARIFVEGRVLAPVPEEWYPFVPAMTPIFVTFTESGNWVSYYLPIYSLLRAGTLWLHPGLLLNPILTALCVLLVASLARRLFPGRPEAPLVAALFMAASSQVLINGMSFYSMPAHLAFNLAWLWFYFRDDRWGWAGVTVLGFLAMGLHQFVMHVLFAFPLLLRLVLRRRWVLSTTLASIYSLGLVGWYLWMREARSQLSTGRITSSWGFPGLDQSLDQAMNLVQVVTWQTPAMIVLVIVALLGIRRLRPEMQDLASSCAFTFVFYFFFLKNQGHGWGYRYFHPVLGNLVLLAVMGWTRIVTETSTRKMAHASLAAFVGISLLGTVFLQLPARMLQVDAFIAPFAESRAFLDEREADIVVIHGDGAWYARDLVRNDPLFRQRPIVLRSERLTPDQGRALAARYRVEMIPPAAFERFGLVPVSPYPEQLIWRSGPPIPVRVERP